MQKIIFFILLFLVNYITYSQVNLDGISQSDLKKYNVSDQAIKEYIDNKQASNKSLSLNSITDTSNNDYVYNEWDDSLKNIKKDKDTNPKYEELVYGHSIFKNNSILIYQKAKEVIAPENYKLGVGDEIVVTTWGYTDYSEKFTISEDGYISPRQVGRIYLKGMTFAKAKHLLRSKFGASIDLSNSDFDVNLVYSRVITVNIVGEVDKPGSYVIPAVNTPFNALIAANGLTKSGSIRNIYIRREGRTIDSLDAYKFLTDERYYNDVFLQNNDYIYVNVAEKVVKIEGAIKRPHNYELKGNEKLKDLLKFCGGFNGNSYTKNILIKRYVNNELKYIDINYDSLLQNKIDFKLYDKDVVFVPQIPDFVKNKVILKGAVKISGEYELRIGDRVSDIIERAEGISYSAYTEKAYILRLNENLSKTYIDFNINNALQNKDSKDNLELKELDEIRILSKKDFTDYFQVYVVGEVRKPDTITYGYELSLKDALLITGGLKKESGNGRIEISRIISSNNDFEKSTPIRAFVETLPIKDDLTIDKDISQIYLQPYDIIYIRKNPDFENPMIVTLGGEIKFPGKYSILRKDEKLSDIIDRAGGLTEFAFPEGAKMQREGVGSIGLNMKRALSHKSSKYNVFLYNNDLIHIPRTLDLVLISGSTHILGDKNISVPFAKHRRAKYYIIQFAGGFDKESDRARTQVIYPNGIIKQTTRLGILNIYPKVKKGSQIVIPEKSKKEEKKGQSKVDWNKAIENITIKMTAVLTIWLLLKNVAN
ncbi:MAG: hypothetical protein A2X12_10175 [Bacteroidetes bacterium GWE2_29_8]|nr:MAG: hypothetical protein A2X12_10175 [Bacteroidetes bacterium GWE2_29_8]OFY18991.1 MAG: hypothetical protein A2X02_03360 [Bacteroidetes bacterium GWF2_29_10]